jgi:hypothetical protein
MRCATPADLDVAERIATTIDAMAEGHPRSVIIEAIALWTRVLEGEGYDPTLLQAYIKRRGDELAAAARAQRTAQPPSD